MPIFSFGTKAQTLAKLQGKLKKASVLPLEYFTIEAYLTSSQKILNRILDNFGENIPLIVRSSALSEDSAKDSMAGVYLSVQNVSGKQALVNAIEQVIQSYGLYPDSLNEILIQPMLLNIIMSGVLFTVDPNTGGNYYIINYDKSGSSASVTSGEGQDLCTYYIFRGHESGDSCLDRLTKAADELIELFGSDKIDIEFAYTTEGELYLLQARPLVLTKPIADYADQQEALLLIHSFLDRAMRPKPYVKGKRTIYGVMPDWNPAEMIGMRPKPLALSLYRRLITDGIWAYQRDNYGYKNLRGFPLMVDFCGLPYIDTRVSFNSFIPKDIDEELTAKLADYYFESLAANQDKHDKVEFDIIFSCYTFDLPERIKILGKHGFSSHEQDVLRESLRLLTNDIINVTNGLWITDTQKIHRLQERREMVMNSDLDTVGKIYWLLEDCARYGTLPFAGLARAGFIAVLLLKSLVTIGILSAQDYENYMRQLNTVGSKMAIDHRELSQSAFLREYGHLRPGTYDITSLRYDAAPELYFGQENAGAGETRESRPFSLTLEQYTAIQSQMERQGLGGDVLALFKFIKAGIEGREHSKFVFTRSLSDSLELIAQLGVVYGFSREDMAFADIEIIDRLYSSTDNPKSLLERSIDFGRKKYAHALTFSLPPVMVSPGDIYAFSLPLGVPNFITLGEVTGNVCADCSGKESISGKILLIPAADPGYDWVFSHAILGFVTAYGGANSHMAIRAGELGIPAVIGAGEKLFAGWEKAKTLHIDCANKKVEILR